MFYPKSVDDTTGTGAVLPTFDALILGPADEDGDVGGSTAATAFVWRTRAWLPPTRHQRQGLSLRVHPTEV